MQQVLTAFPPPFPHRQQNHGFSSGATYHDKGIAVEMPHEIITQLSETYQDLGHPKRTIQQWVAAQDIWYIGWANATPNTKPCFCIGRTKLRCLHHVAHFVIRLCVKIPIFISWRSRPKPIERPKFNHQILIPTTNTVFVKKKTSFEHRIKNIPKTTPRVHNPSVDDSPRLLSRQ